jgi:uncharacterized 2Fe-2S/4Fe-4S cluster protein (DUF4445 family)
MGVRMDKFRVAFQQAVPAAGQEDSHSLAPQVVLVSSGTLLSEAAHMAGIEISQPCGGQGRCGRCAVQILEGSVRRRSTLRLSAQDIEQGYALACQTVVEGDVAVLVPEQERIDRRLTSDRTVSEISVPAWYGSGTTQTLRRVNLRLSPPSLDDQTDDLSRLRIALRSASGINDFQISLPMLQRLAGVVRASNWEVCAILDVQPELHGRPRDAHAWLVDLLPGHTPEEEPLWGAAIDIGTTTVTLWLVDLVSGEVRAQVSEYNGQIARGEDVISRIIYASKNGGADEMRSLVLKSIHSLLETACKRVSQPGKMVASQNVMKAAISGNSTMIHLLAGLPAANIRLAPFVTTVNHVPVFRAREIGLELAPDATVDCLPGVASYVGADITAGVLSSGMDDTEALTLFMDVGTNGEIVLGSREWLVTCACSAGPAFEGAGVKHGMRATRGAIEEVWINSETYEPTYRVIGGGRPRGLCGSGLISLLAEGFMTSILDKGGNLNTHLNTPRIREGEHGLEYVVAWENETDHGQAVALTRVDVDNLLRAKAAIYAGYTVLADSVGIPLELIEQMLIGGSFGKYINIEKAIQIGLLPDMPWDRFEFLGNTSVKGAYYALLNKNLRQRLDDIAARMTYVELSADNAFYDAFMAAMFLPHTDVHRFPSVNRERETALHAVNQA